MRTCRNRALADIALANIHRNPPTAVDFAKQGLIPLLFIGLGEDHVVPPKATMHNERKYDDSVSMTEYKEFEGRPHVPGAPGGGRGLRLRFGRASRWAHRGRARDRGVTWLRG